MKWLLCGNRKCSLLFLSIRCWWQENNWWQWLSEVPFFFFFLILPTKLKIQSLRTGGIMSGHFFFFFFFFSLNKRIKAGWGPACRVKVDIWCRPGARWHPCPSLRLLTAEWGSVLSVPLLLLHHFTEVLTTAVSDINHNCWVLHKWHVFFPLQTHTHSRYGASLLASAKIQKKPKTKPRFVSGMWTCCRQNTYELNGTVVWEYHPHFNSTQTLER